MPEEIFYFRESAIPARIADIPDDILAPLRSGLQEARLVEIAYRNNTWENTLRKVLPEVLFRSGDSWYLAAFCHLRNEARTFRLDRIGSARLTEISDTTHGVAQELREHGVPWRQEQNGTPGGADAAAGPGSWLKLEIELGENEPEVVIAGHDAGVSAFDAVMYHSWDLVSHAEEGKLDRVREDLAAGAKIDFLSGTGETPLTAAAKNTLRMLLSLK